VIVSIHQPGYLPWPGYFHRLALSDVHVFFDDVHYERRGLNNRNRIKTAHGPLWLSVPVRYQGRFSGVNFIKDIGIADTPWPRQHWRSLLMNYRQAPYFEQHASFFERIYQQKWERLLPLNVEIINYFLKELGLRPRIVFASELLVPGQKSDRVLNLCRALGATVYLSGALGANYLEVEKFEAEGIRVVFQEYHFPTYPQLYPPFLPNLSMADLLFNCGPRSLDILMSNNQSRCSIETFSRLSLGSG